MKTYLVGGAVRDSLLGEPVTERDWVVVGSTPETLLKLGYEQVGKDFPVFLHPQTHEEYALARTERKTGKGYSGFECHASPDVTLIEDLKRRDLTINAIAKAENGALIDPFNGQKDLDNGLLRHVSPAFQEDPVRILRIARFAARFAHRGFKVAHDTHALMKKMVTNGEVDALVPERVWKECERALKLPNPERFFEVLYRCGALSRIFPELAGLFPETVASSHDKQNQVSTEIAALERLKVATALYPEAEKCGLIRFAALLQPLSENVLKQLLKRMKIPNEYAELSCLIIVHYPACCQHPVNTASDLLSLLQNLDTFRRPQRFALFLDICCAILGEMNPDCVQQLQQAQALASQVEAKQFVAQGLRGGEIKQALFAARQEVLKNLL